jgi:hypothetical protein
MQPKIISRDKPGLSHPSKLLVAILATLVLVVSLPALSHVSAAAAGA